MGVAKFLGKVSQDGYGSPVRGGRMARRYCKSTAQFVQES